MPPSSAVILLARNEGALRRAKVLQGQVTHPTMQRAVDDVLTILRGVPGSLKQASDGASPHVQREAVARALQAQATVLDQLEALVRDHGPGVERVS